MTRKNERKMTYTKEFKQEAVKLSLQDGVSVSQVAKELGIGLTTLNRWRSESRQHGEEAFPGKGHQTPENAEITHLKRELARVKRERDILKKAITFFRDDV